MEYRRFGKTNKEISVITLGGMRYKKGWDSPRDELPQESIDNCLEITDHALKEGINHIETAYGYGKSENLYGLVLDELKVDRNSYCIMTKGTASTGDEMRARVDDQLKSLRLDKIDFYGYHGINNLEIFNQATKENGPVEALLELKEEGVIGSVGFSTHADVKIILDTIMTDMFDFMNLHFYYFFQRNLAAVELAKHKDMGVFIISPNEKGGKLFNPSQKVADICSPLSPIQFNARFCLSHSQITTLSFGLNELDHFKELDGMFNNELYLNGSDRKIKLELDNCVNELGDSYCTTCGDCMPCPEDINIPEILRFRNMSKAYDMIDFGKFRYNMLESKGHWFPGTYGNACTDCGDCLPKCPVQLNIPELLRSTHQELFIEK
ncbi:MAG: aldo/keto reductase [Planctomycetota bacterium]|nr:MAG: aldo/keto reductase [Planctomycetota bacterium]